MVSISVVVPTYNRKDRIQRAIDSVLNQTRRPDEVIIIDDGSDDDTRSLVKTHYPDIDYIWQQNSGVSAARNAGISRANGDWIAFLDADDVWQPDKLQRQENALKERPEYLVAHSNETWIRNGIRVNPMDKHRKYGGYIYRRCLPLCVISPSSVIIHRSVFDQTGTFDESLPVCEDYDMWLRICARFPLLYIDEELIMKYGGHSDQLSRQYWGMDRFRIKALEKILATEQLSSENKIATTKILQEKIRIYLNGAEKHQNTECVPEFEALAARYS